MWSGPRNISTAMMRSWGARSDTVVIDEPLYAHYLDKTGFDHPGAKEVLQTHERDWQKVVQELTGVVPEGKSIWFQKHMTHHMLDNIDRTWTLNLTNVFLVRSPASMLASLVQIVPNPTIEQTGLPQQLELFNLISQHTGTSPPVIDAKDVLQQPRRTLSTLCACIGVPFVDDMLLWKQGPRKTDGIWAKHWYAGVEDSTEFAPYVDKDSCLPSRLTSLARECDTYFDALIEFRVESSAC